MYLEGRTKRLAEGLHMQLRKKRKKFKSKGFAKHMGGVCGCHSPSLGG
jgi:hypothetical protein